jgi:DNA-binding MarR family transcriptional regulator
MKKMPKAPSSPLADAERDPVLQFLRLMWEVDHELQRLSKRMLQRIGLTGPQRLVVRLIGQQPGVSPGEVARHLHLDPGTVTVVVRRLEADGLVDRDAHERDTRRSRLTLTAGGRAVNRRRGGTVESAVRRVLTRVGARDAAAARDVLAYLARALRHTQPPVRRAIRVGRAAVPRSRPR